MGRSRIKELSEPTNISKEGEEDYKIKNDKSIYKQHNELKLWDILNNDNMASDRLLIPNPNVLLTNVSKYCKDNCNLR